MAKLNNLKKQELEKLVEARDNEINALLKITTSLKGHFQLDNLLKEIMTTTKEILNSEACSLLLVNKETEELYFYATDDTGMNLNEIFLKKGQGIAGHVVESGKPVIVNNAQEDPHFFIGVDNTTGFVTKSMICVPMSIGDRILGAVEILNKLEGEYNQHDLRLLELVSIQSALAIEYTRSNEKRSMNDRMAVIGGTASAIIHDLNNSMSIIKGYTQLIDSDDTPNSEYCNIINSEIDKLTGMCREFLDFSRGTQISINPVSLSLTQILTYFYDTSKESFKKADIDYRLEIYDQCKVKIDQEKFSRVILNMISNAEDSLEEGPDKQITLKGGLHNDKAVIIVEDNGKGMDRATQKKIFSPFFSTGKKKGTGLGMAIVKNIIDSHNAKIEIDSETGKGSTFTITFNKFEKI